ncbi:MAG TPA: phytoene/squalene synthase family protein [Terriglobales bacterium]|nr:phytoene/squalene synthase family protein [Terriglobales bacterium]
MSGAGAQLAHAHAVCRGVTRRAARNFYYAFLVLPREKRDALCAVYAFMRHCDDLCDEPGVPLSERRARLEAWRETIQQVLAGQATDDPVLFALADAQKRFSISPELFDKLVQGTAMDLPPQDAAAGAVLTFADFDELHRYCYHVASVVGLVTIRIFGYRDPAAEPLAEKCGIAFQLTNIIRDVKEDAGLGRIYLPEEDLALFGRSPEDLAPGALRNGFDPAKFRPVLEFETGRAREFYRAADQLLPLLDHDSQPAFWVLVEIYRRLLEKIAERGYNVFGEKIRMTMPQKLAILSRGFLRRLYA